MDPNIKKVFVCPVCGIEVSTEEKLKEHKHLRKVILEHWAKDTLRISSKIVAETILPKNKEKVITAGYTSMIYSEDLSEEHEKELQTKLLKKVIAIFDKHTREMRAAMRKSQRCKKRLIEAAKEAGIVLNK